MTSVRMDAGSMHRAALSAALWTMRAKNFVAKSLVTPCSQHAMPLRGWMHLDTIHSGSKRYMNSTDASHHTNPYDLPAFVRLALRSRPSSSKTPFEVA